MDDLVLRLAQSQGGVVTTAQARTLGWDKRSLRAAVRGGVFVDLGRGLYAVPSPAVRTAEGRHQILCRGALLLYPDAVISHASAVLAHSLPVFGVDLSRGWLSRPVRSEVNTQSFVIRPHLEADHCVTDWGPAVRPALAIIQLTLDHGVVAGVVAGDRATHEGLVTAADLQQVAATVKGWPRSARVTTMLAKLDGRSESVGESRLRLDLDMAGIPVVPQLVVNDEDEIFVGRVDFGVEGSPVLIEFDGLVKYREGGADALIAEKSREDRLRGLGYLVVRVKWAELDRPQLVLHRVRQAMLAATASMNSGPAA
ncbi:MAG: type IV toxin-antitoxin system AbiEi family antitoxin domain-containing protein [Lapillicoccus sp.]